MVQIPLPDPDATEALGVRLARHRPPAAVAYLRGDLGAGKSTLARALLRSLGVTGTIRSPTYTLVERYPLADDGEAWHLDLYRIADAGELEYLGLDADGVTLWLVEWAERGGGALPPADLVVELRVEGAGRQARLVPASEAGGAWVDAVRTETVEPSVAPPS
ncbi:tRNA (adenosine(37)-N6)-threonylcarbamoyltransferase complex ATPase subunit type 1 TsaE [Lysobacter sp. SG-8]|uniref:tRNA threonylcarbamoyladenosine biosynthesis protein TsaE n=1 Tax=Marilutibacter penaei TaxID=2759900 RepID=A0A7W3YDJ1_9GAMM|nr:tRNA (adenosine(37)-N6)-threonylcarbamoyltransferase complex ATPase subunit type 1 TsaE [Lysobacter penaei]